MRAAGHLDEVVILAARRTPMGAFAGAFAALSAPELGACAVRAVLQDAAIEPGMIDEVLMGCVLQAGLGQAPARQVARTAGIPDGVGAVTINKVCGSGMKAIMLGHDMIRAGSADTVLAGGMESMTNAPYLLPGARAGYHSGDRQVIDHMLHDGLRNVDDGELMGVFAEQCAERYGFTRTEQDAFGAESMRRVRAAMDSGAFHDELCAVPVVTGEGNRTVREDEPPLRCRPEAVARLKPVFRPRGGTVTAAGSAGIADGAAAVILTRAAVAARQGLKPLARIVGHAGHACAPGDFTTAPAPAIRRLYERTGWNDARVDLYEINEAFAVVVLAAMRDLGLHPARVNVNGGACALGHPIGASGARLVVTLVHALRRRALRRGIAALCIGGGEATALALEVA